VSDGKLDSNIATVTLVVALAEDGDGQSNRSGKSLSGKKEKQDEELDPRRLAEITGLRFPIQRPDETQP
jgi:hypothetical protein